MQLNRTRNTVLALAALTALAAGCSDDDKKTVKNFINNDGGTTARDTLDLNRGTDAEMTDLDLTGVAGAFPAGHDGNPVAHFEQDAQVEQVEEDFDAFNHFRVLGSEPGTDGDVDNHERDPYNGFYRLHAQSPSKRFWALVKDGGDFPRLHEDEEDTPRTFSVVCYDSEAQRYSREVDLVQVIEDDTVFSAPDNSDQSPEMEQVLVDNTGLVTLFFTACPPINFGFDDVEDETENDPNAIYAAQLDARSGKIVRQPEVVSSAYENPREDNSEIEFRGAAVAANGDIVLLYEKDDNDANQRDGDEGVRTLETVYYSRSLDAFGEGQRVEDEFTDIEEDEDLIDADLDTDGRHFQVVVAYQFDDVNEDYVVSRRVDTLDLRERLNESADPSAELAGAFGEDATLYRTGLGGFGGDEGIGGALRINFGRNGTSIVHWFARSFDNGATGWIAAATGAEEVEGSHQVGSTVALLAGGQGERFQINRNGKNQVQFDATPQYAFTDDDTAVIVFGLFDNGDNQALVGTSDESIPVLYAATFDRLGEEFRTPNAFENDSALNGAELDRIDNARDGNFTRIEVEANLSGFTRGNAGSGPTCVVAWRSAYFTTEDEFDEGSGIPEPSFDHHHLAAVLFRGLLNTNDVGSFGDEEISPDFLEATSAYRIDNFHLASTNDVKTGSSYRFQFDDTVDPDSLPATGTGNVWIAWRQFVPHPDEDQSQFDGDETIPTTGLHRAFLYNFNPGRHDALAGHHFPEDFSDPANIDEDGDHQNEVDGLDPRLEFGDQNAHVNAIEGIWPHTAGEGTTIFLRQHGTSMKFEFAPSRSETSTPGISEGGRIAPEDMLAHNADARAHVDGMGFSFNVDSKGKFKKSFHGGGRIWSIFDGSDHRSQRVFGKRTR